MKLVTAAQMRAMEQRAVDSGVSLDALMDQAGLAVAQEVWLTLGTVDGRRILVLAGPGNNGGDGLVAAKHLAEWGADVVVYIPLNRRLPDRRADEARAAGAHTITHADDPALALLQEAIDGAELVIDALLGIGRARAIDGVLAEVLDRLAAARVRALPPRVIAVDLPTGVDADSGNADPRAVHADITVTFQCAKVGLYMLPGSQHAGRVQVVDIAIPEDPEAQLTELLDVRRVREWLPERPLASNKGTFGRVVAVAGSSTYPGAARLACEAAYRSGAGLVTLACHDDVRLTVAPAAPEVTYLPLGAAIAFSPADVPRVRDALRPADVLLVGCGIGSAEDTSAAVTDLLSSLPPVRALVIDADGLNALARQVGWAHRISGPAILTPHPGEMARLLRREVAEIQGDRLNIAAATARELGHVVVLKGAHTIVAAPDGRTAIDPHANPLLASAGTGDVLAGLVAGFAAQGVDPFDAACCGVFVHAFVAEDLREEFGDRGMTASDLLAAVPRGIRIIREGRKPAPMAWGGLLGGLGGGLDPSLGSGESVLSGQ